MEDKLFEPAFAEAILHPTDLSEGNERAFAHALSIAVRTKASLTILHAGKGERDHQWTEFPSVRGTLEKWGRLDKGSARGDVFRSLNVRVKKVSLKSKRPLTAVLDYLEEHPADLIVLGTEGRGGLPRWIRPSTAEAIARRSDAKTLFLPGSARGFVSPENGRLTIERILVPVDRHPDPRAAILAAERVAATSEKTPVSAVALHLGATDISPELQIPKSERCLWSSVTHPGEVVDEIVRVAEEQAMDMIVMATEGHDGILDALRGSVTEQVLRRAPCPVLAVPARSKFR
jgi:nucleotide-binding universal stress UspA family protein